MRARGLMGGLLAIAAASSCTLILGANKDYKEVDGGAGGKVECSCPSPQDPCHIAVCDEVTKACTTVAGNDGAQCDDGDPCTSGDTCSAGACQAGAPTDCSGLDTECTVGACAPGVGCQATNSNEGMPCAIKNVCATSQCMAGKCTATTLFNGKVCDDGLFCTENDKCSNAACAGQPKVCQGATSCLVAGCDEDSKTCALTPRADGTVCDDGDACTMDTTCKAGACGSGKTISSCTSGDQCCPVGCTENNDSDCAVYWRSGVQQNVPEAVLIGWTQCHSDTYATGGTSLATILNQCSKAKLLMACRPVGAQSFSLVAMGPRADVLFDCGDQTNCTKQSNGVGWYYSTSRSWGFAPGGADVNRDSCDFNAGGQVDANLRLCWHTGAGNLNIGYRCGDNQLNGNAMWERRVYHAN